MVENSSFRSAGDPIEAAARRNARESVIDQDCFFEGTFRTPGNMRIEGAYQGAIECQGTLLIAESGQVNARIVAGNLIVAGQFSGEVQCQSRFELLKSGRVSGAVSTQSTVIHDGAFFEGEIRMGGREPSFGESVSPLSQQLPSQAQSPSPGISTAAAATEAPVRASTPSTSSRRRAASEPSETADTATAADPAEEANEPPNLNGRPQTGSTRDIVPNRAAES
ncbi:MAG: polymer-forming cytoskeletal protein [Dehalococcoidia bacterium]